MKTYYTRYGDSRPYKVDIKNNILYVYMLDLTHIYKKKPTFKTKFFYKDVPIFRVSGLIKKVFVGRDIDGYENTLLIAFSDRYHIYISGNRIYSFTSYSKITEYYSPVSYGIPLPYAIDIDNNYYLFYNHAVINVGYKLKYPYTYYHDNLRTRLKYGNAFIMKNTEMVPLYHNILQIYHGTSILYLPYAKDKVASYEKLVGKNNLYVKKIGSYKEERDQIKNVKIYKLSKDEYIKIMDDYEKLPVKVGPIQNLIIHFSFRIRILIRKKRIKKK